MAATNFSGERRQNFGKVGGPVFYNVALNVVIDVWLSNTRFTNGWKHGENVVKFVGRLV